MRNDIGRADIEGAVREALQFRVRDVTADRLRPREAVVARRSPWLRSHLAVAGSAVAVVAVVVATVAIGLGTSALRGGSEHSLAGGDPAASAASAASAAVGYRWNLTAVTERGVRTAVPAGTNAYIELTRNMRVGASDGVNFLSGDLALTKNGFTVGNPMTTAALSATQSRTSLLVMQALNRVFMPAPGTDSRTPVAARISGNDMDLVAGSYTLTFVRGKATPDWTAPASTGPATPPSSSGRPTGPATPPSSSAKPTGGATPPGNSAKPTVAPTR